MIVQSISDAFQRTDSTQRPKNRAVPRFDCPVWLSEELNVHVLSALSCRDHKHAQVVMMLLDSLAGACNCTREVSSVCRRLKKHQTYCCS